MALERETRALRGEGLGDMPCLLSECLPKAFSPGMPLVCCGKPGLRESGGSGEMCSRLGAGQQELNDRSSRWTVFSEGLEGKNELS